MRVRDSVITKEKMRTNGDLEPGLEEDSYDHEVIFALSSGTDGGY